jgi:integrase
MASAHRYTWTRQDGTKGEGWRAKWAGADGQPDYKRGFDRKSDAVGYAQDREAEARHGVTIEGERPSGKTTVDQWVLTWLASRDVQPGSADSYRYTLARVTDAFGGRTLASLRTSEILAWKRGLSSRYAKSTADQTVSLLAMLLRDAVRDKLLPESPMPSEKGTKGKSVRLVDPEEILTLEQVRAWDAAFPPHARGLAIVAATTGLRQGELLGLCTEHLSMLKRQARVEQQLQRGGFVDPKTSAGVRTVPLPAAAVEALAAHMAAFPSPPGEPIFLTRQGNRWTRSGFNSAWTAAKTRAGLPEWAHWHALRDVAASSLIWQGCDVQTIVTILGHSSVDELKTYARLWPGAVDRAADALDRLWGTALEGPR